MIAHGTLDATPPGWTPRQAPAPTKWRLTMPDTQVKVEWGCRHIWADGKVDVSSASREHIARGWVDFANKSDRGQAGEVRAELIKRTIFTTTGDWETESDPGSSPA